MHARVRRAASLLTWDVGGVSRLPVIDCLVHSTSALEADASQASKAELPPQVHTATGEGLLAQEAAGLVDSSLWCQRLPRGVKRVSDVCQMSNSEVSDECHTCVR